MQMPPKGDAVTLTEELHHRNQVMKKTWLVLALLASTGMAQDQIGLKDAVRLALEKNKSIQASAAASKASETQVTEARSGYLPKVNYAESWTRSNNPVFVFSSLLTQHQFNEENFQLGPLNRPGFLNNFQSLVTADQSLFDSGRTRHNVRAAGLAKDMASEDHRLTRMEVIAGVVRAYYGVVLNLAQLNAANQAKRSAQADLEQAQNVRTAGMSTDADVLSIRVHLARVEEQRIRRSADLDVARAALNEVLGLALDAPHTLTTALAPVTTRQESLQDFETNAIAERPEARQAKLATDLAANNAAQSRSALLPEVSLHSAFEADRQRFSDRGGANWLVSVGMRWNLFNGFGDKSRIEASKFVVDRREAEQEHAGAVIRLQVRRAYADLEAAGQRIAVAEASVAQAEESLRITQNRYQAGMSGVTDLLRTETDVLEARMRYLAAVHDQRIAAAMLEMAAGTLTEDSEVLK
jgi:outer membrane protein TolC